MNDRPKNDPAENSADMEAEAGGVLAIAPYLLAKYRQRDRVTAVRHAVREAMLGLGYPAERAEDTAEKLAAHLLVIEGPPMPTKEMVFQQIQAAREAQANAPVTPAPAKKPER